MKHRFAISFLLLAPLMGACGGGGATGGADMTAGPADFAGAVGKLCTDARADAWTLPIAKTSANGKFAVTLLSSAASPPLIGDLTEWTVQVGDAAASGAPIDGATIDVKPFMPDHGHGTDAVAHVMPGSAAGQYAITPLYLFMAGYWTVTLTITNGAVTDTVVYSVCLSDS
jgi:hypothetical protein